MKAAPFPRPPYAKNPHKCKNRCKLTTFFNGAAVPRGSDARSLPYPSRSRAVPAGCHVGGPGVIEPPRPSTVL